PLFGDPIDKESIKIELQTKVANSPFVAPAEVEGITSMLMEKSMNDINAILTYPAVLNEKVNKGCFAPLLTSAAILTALLFFSLKDPEPDGGSVYPSILEYLRHEHPGIPRTFDDSHADDGSLQSRYQKPRSQHQEFGSLQ